MITEAPWRIEPISPQDEQAFALNVAVVYQETLTLTWAMQHCERAGRLHGDLCPQSTWWKLHYLTSRAILVDAVQAASSADVIMVSVSSFEQSPPGLQEWIDGWLACRPPHEGSLIALIGVPEDAETGASFTREYLRAVADRARLHYVEHERKLPAEQPDLHTERRPDARLETAHAVQCSITSDSQAQRGD